MDLTDTEDSTQTLNIVAVNWTFAKTYHVLGHK